MDFDLSSAKPVDTGFDLSSAKPAEESQDQPKKPGKIGWSRDVENFESSCKTAVGAGEAALNMVTGGLAAIPAGLAGLGKTAYNLYKGKGLSDSLADAGGTTARVQEALTYEPRTTMGKAEAEAAAIPMEVASSLLGKVTEPVYGAVGEMVGGKEGRATGANIGRSVGETAIPLALAAGGGRRTLKPMAEAKPVPGKDFSPLRELTPEQADRFHRMKSQGLDPTLGNVTRDPSQVRFEQQVAPTKAGERIFQRTKEQDADLTSNIEKLKTGSSGPRKDIGLSEADTGRSVRSSLESKAASKMQIVDDLYEEARASGETKAKVDVSPLTKYLADNEAAAIAVKELKSISAGLRKLIGEDESVDQPIGHGKISSRMTKKQVADKEPPGVTIDDIEFLRQEAGRLAQKDGSVKSYMGDIRKIIDKITEGKGGEKYQQARAARKSWGDEFEEQGAVAGILDKKSRSDYGVAVEDVWKKTVIGGSEADLQNVINSLKGQGPTDGTIRPGSKPSVTKQQQDSAAQSLKDIQNQTIDYIIESATHTGTVSPAGLKKAIQSIGLKKLDMLLGPKAVTELQRSLQTAKDIKTNPAKVPGSDTNLNRRTMAERLASEHAEHIIKGVLPRFAGRVIDSVRNTMTRNAETQKMETAVDESLTPRRASMADIEDAAKATRKERRQYVMKEAASRSAPAAAAAVMSGDDE